MGETDSCLSGFISYCILHIAVYRENLVKTVFFSTHCTMFRVLRVELGSTIKIIDIPEWELNRRSSWLRAGPPRRLLRRQFIKLGSATCCARRVELSEAMLCKIMRNFCRNIVKFSVLFARAVRLVKFQNVPQLNSM